MEAVRVRFRQATWVLEKSTFIQLISKLIETGTLVAVLL
jgi:hypothetical protein